jgi:predicted membrane-bound spermidine synthase
LVVDTEDDHDQAVVNPLAKLSPKITLALPDPLDPLVAGVPVVVAGEPVVAVVAVVVVVVVVLGVGSPVVAVVADVAVVAAVVAAVVVVVVVVVAAAVVAELPVTPEPDEPLMLMSMHEVYGADPGLKIQYHNIT